MKLENSNKHQTIPNLLVAGFPKCGTTSLYDWLVAHPLISGGIDKELFYLIDLDDDRANKNSNWSKHKERGYSKLFNNRNKVLVDGTTHTVFQESALEFSAKHQPKVIIVIREPAARIYSNFKYFRDTRTKINKDISFSKYYSSIKNKIELTGDQQIDNCIEQSDYAYYIEKWLKVVGEKNLRIIVFENLVHSPIKHLDELCKWLEVGHFDFDKGLVLRAKNPSFEVRSRGLNRVKEFSKIFIKNRKLKETLKPFYRLINGKKGTSILSSEKATIEEIKEDFSALKSELIAKYSIDLERWN